MNEEANKTIISDLKRQIDMRGISSLSDEKLLAIILRESTGGRDILRISKAILERFSLQDLTDIPGNHVLSKINGLTEDSLVTIRACCELYNRINRAKKETFDYDKEKDRNGGIWQGFQFGPVVLQDGEIPTGLKKNERHPRIIFGYCEPGHYVLVAVDGRTKTSIGMTEQEMGELMQSLGCKDAMNLDGGTSAVMLFMGKTINIPSGKDKDGDGVAGRMIADLLAFAEYDADGNAPDLSLVTPDKVYGE